MRILIMVKSLTYGGAERVAVSWANGLSKLGHKVSIFTDLTLPVTYLPDKNVTLIPLQRFIPKSTKGIYSIINKAKNLINNVCQIRDVINRYKPDAIVNVLYMDAHHLLLGRMFSERKVPIIMTDHNAYERPEGMDMPLSQWINKFVDNRLFDRVTVLTNADKEILLKRGLKNVRVLRNPLFLTPTDTIPPKEKIVLAIGRLDAWQCKGFDILAKTWKCVYEKHPDWKLIIKGNKDLKVVSMLKEIAGESSSSIEFKEYDERVLNEYRRASIFVLSSRCEGWGLVSIEAMSQGCATIACDYKGRQAEYITNYVNGLLCEPDNPQMLGEMICYLIENEDVMTKLQKEAIQSVEEFAEENVANNLLSVIKEVI